MVRYKLDDDGHLTAIVTHFRDDYSVPLQSIDENLEHLASKIGRTFSVGDVVVIVTLDEFRELEKYANMYYDE